MTAQHEQLLIATQLRWCLDLRFFVQENALLEGLVRFSYDLETGLFNFGGYFCELSAKWVHAMTGLPWNGLVPDMRAKGKSTLWERHLRTIKNRKGMETLLRQLVVDEENSEDFIRVLVCYILSFLLFPNGSGSLARWSAKYCDDLQTFRNYDWSEAVQRAIMESIADRKKKLVEATVKKRIYYISGFVLLLSVRTLFFS